MKMFSSIHSLAAIGAGLLLSVSVVAAPVTFETSYENSSVAVSDTSGVSLGDVRVSLADSLAGHSFSLTGNDSHTFDFFDIRLPSLGAGRVGIDATLSFLEPLTASASGNASGRWGSFLIGSTGRLSWDEQPGVFEMEDGSLFEVIFADKRGIQLGRDTTVTATVTHLGGGAADPSPVPEPGTLALLALGLLGIGMARSRRNGANPAH